MPIKISYLKISKFFFLLMMIYYSWFRYVFFEIPNLMLLFGMCVFLPLLIFYYIEDHRILVKLPHEYILWILFFAYAFISGIFVSADKSIFFVSLMSCFQYLLVGYCVFLIVDKDKKLDFFVHSIIFVSVIAAITTILFPVEVPLDPGRFTMGLTNNANSLGISMTMGVFCALYQMNLKSLMRTLLLFIAIALMFYTIILSGSRKSLLSLAILIVVWLLFVFWKFIKPLSPKRKFASISLIIILISVSIFILTPLFDHSVLFSRLAELFQSGVADSRVRMYEKAIILFQQNPVIGIGFDQFSVVSGFNKYSHSTYAEALSCTGIIGAILYFTAYLTILIKLILKLKKGQENQYAFLWIAAFFIFVFLGTGMIHFYELDSNIIFGMMISYANLKFININDQQKITEQLST